MKIKFLSMSSIRPEGETDMKREQFGLKQMLASSAKFGYDHEILYVKTQFGGQMPVVVDWCEKNKENYTHIAYTDAFDTLALDSFEHFQLKVHAHYKDHQFVGSAEKGCYPNPDLAKDYPLTTHDWRYVNAGQWFASIEWILKIAGEVNPQGINDQTWLSEAYLRRCEVDYGVTLDYKCELFQSIAFEGEYDFATTRNGRLINRKTGSLPIWTHGNGHTNMDWVYEIVDAKYAPSNLSVDSVGRVSIG
jgi:hypothetical protein